MVFFEKEKIVYETIDELYLDDATTEEIKAYFDGNFYKRLEDGTDGYFLTNEQVEELKDTCKALLLDPYNEDEYPISHDEKTLKKLIEICQYIQQSTNWAQDKIKVKFNK